MRPPADRPPPADRAAVAGITSCSACAWACFSCFFYAIPYSRARSSGGDRQHRTLNLYYARIANMGDLLNRRSLSERCFGYSVERCSFLTGDLCAIGSGLAQYKLHGNPLMKLQQCINGRTHPHVDVWGSGFINYDDAQGRFFKRDMCFHAVRGALTRRSVERMTGRTLDIPDRRRRHSYKAGCWTRCPKNGMISASCRTSAT